MRRRSSSSLPATVRRSLAAAAAAGPTGTWYSLRGPARSCELRPEGTAAAPESLLGTTAPPSWHGIALSFAADDSLCDPPIDAVGVVLDRSGRFEVAVRDGDGVMHLGCVGVTGLVADVANRILGLPTSPEPTDPSALVVASWLQAVLDAAADPATRSTVATWAGAVALHPAASAGRALGIDPSGPTPSPDDVVDLTETLAWQLPWDRMRRRVAAGHLVVPDLSAANAAWMDWPFFARWTLGVHRPVTELLDDLCLFLDGRVLGDLRYTVAALGWLGFADSHAS